MNDHHVNYIRFAVGQYVYYSVRGCTCGDDTAREILRSAFRIIRDWLNRGKSIDEALRHIDNLTLSASFA